MNITVFQKTKALATIAVKAPHNFLLRQLLSERKTEVKSSKA